MPPHQRLESTMKTPHFLQIYQDNTDAVRQELLDGLTADARPGGAMTSPKFLTMPWGRACLKPSPNCLSTTPRALKRPFLPGTARPWRSVFRLVPR